MERIERADGVRLMRLWGLPEWPDVDADYRLWNGCCVFAFMRHGEVTDLHMAMMEGKRRHCESAVNSAIEMLERHGVLEVRALIEESKVKVLGFSVKMGFRFNSKFSGVGHDGSISNVIDMRRSLWVG